MKNKILYIIAGLGIILSAWDLVRHGNQKSMGFMILMLFAISVTAHPENYSKKLIVNFGKVMTLIGAWGLCFYFINIFGFNDNVQLVNNICNILVGLYLWRIDRFIELKK
jgi:predicted membrane protein